MKMTSNSKPQRKPGILRRDLLKISGAGSLLAAGGHSLVNAQETRGEKPDRVVDVLVVGSGAAAASAALHAHEAGSDVLMVEKALLPGGTSNRSGGIYWIPNNVFLRKQGIVDSREDCIAFMARCAWPALFDPADAKYGLTDDLYALLAAFYDNASPAVEGLRDMGALEFAQWMQTEEQAFPDYYYHLPENRTPRGRGLYTVSKDGFSEGASMMRQLHDAISTRKIPILTEHRAEGLILNDRGEVTGLEVTDSEGEKRLFQARRAVIFASGGFTHNVELCREFLRGPVFGGCTVPYSEGDFVRIGASAGAKLANMNHAWWWQVVLEHAIQSRETSSVVHVPAGDSMILVNCDGRRVVNEKTLYNERTQVHFTWDPVRARYPNLILFAIYDEFTRERYGRGLHMTSSPMVLQPGINAPHILSGETLEELTAVIETRLSELEEHTGGFKLDPAFHSNLEKTIARFNGFAETGKDLDFQRGSVPREIIEVEGRFPGNDKPNQTMYPISDKGPYYAVMLAPGVLDTKGGPKINARAQVIDDGDQPIPGLYGAGNCIGSPAGQAYWAGGSTLGLALTFGAIAGKNAAREPVKSVSVGQRA